MAATGTQGSGVATIRWTRIVLGALLLEALLFVVLVPLGEIVPNPFAFNPENRDGNPTIYFTAVPVGCFVFGFLVTAWLFRRLPSRFVLHGTLVGVVATAIYLAICAASPGSIPGVIAGYGPPLFYVSQGLRIAGCVAGALYQGRRTGG